MKMHRNFPWDLCSIKMLHIAAFLLITAVSSFASAETLQKRVVQSSDDAEERSSGSVVLNSSDLELVFDKTRQQTIGIRFTDLAIPPNAVIDQAYIQFDADEVNTIPTELLIEGEDTDSATTFNSTAFNISSRIPTFASADWSPPEWNVVHEQSVAQRTPNISSIIQEIVDRPDWSAGNSIAILLSGTGERTAEAYDGTSSAAPLLHVDFSGGDPVNQAPTVNAGMNTSITLPNNAAQFGDAIADDDGLPDGSTLAIDWELISSSTGGTVSFSPSANVPNPTVTFSSTGVYHLQLTADDGLLAASDTVQVTVFPEGSSIIMINMRVSASSDDVEERSDGRMILSSSDLEIVTDKGAKQTVGIRFAGLAIPNDALIRSAYIQFAVDETNTEATSVTLEGHNVDSASTFTSTAFDASFRARTASNVGWQPLAWDVVQAQGSAQRTPNISSIVQEIISRPGWQSGNALAVLISGSGERTAESFDGASAAAPLLHVEYSSSTPPSSISTWADLNIRLGTWDIGVDSVNNRLLHSLPGGYDTPQNLIFSVQFDLENLGYSLAFNSGGPQNSGTDVNIQNVQYGSTVPVELYKDGVFVESYSLLFTNQPIIELTAPSIVDEPKSPGTFKLTSAEFGQATGVLQMGIEFRGSTSQAFPKKSFSIELVETPYPGEEEKLVLLDLRKDGDWLMDATYRDTSFVRNMVSMDLFNDMRPFAFIDENNLPRGQAAIRGYQVEAILNERYHGAYILEERIDRKLLDMDKVNVPEDEFGNELWNQVDFTDPENGTVLYKADANNADLYTAQSVTGFEQKYPDDKDVTHFGPLVELIDFINNASDTDFINLVGSILDIDSVVDFWLMTQITQNRDSLKKNYYLARNKSEKWYFIPWDNDATFGMRWDGSPYTSTNWWDPEKNNLIRRLSELPATGFNSIAKTRWSELRSTLVTTEALVARFASYRDYSVPIALESENARTRNFIRWPDSGGAGVNNPELGELVYIENWIADRIAFLDVQIMAQPEF